VLKLGYVYATIFSTMTEFLQKRQPLISKIKEGAQRFIAARTPDMVVGDIAEIDFGDLYDNHGITTIFADRDGTLADYKSSTVPHNFRAAFSEGRHALQKRGTDLHVSVMTNTPPSDPESLVGLIRVMKDVGAEDGEVPDNAGDRKPSQRMPLKLFARSYARNRTRPNQVAVIGDKRTADVLAAHNAGFFSILVDHKRVGPWDSVGDKLLRRPYEAFLGWLDDASTNGNIRPEPSKAVRGLMDLLEGVQAPEAIIYNGGVTHMNGKPDWLTPDLEPIWNYSKIAGFGAQKVELPQEVLDAIPPTTYTVLKEKMLKAAEAIDPRIKDQVQAISEKAHNIVYEKGGDIADDLDLIRKHVLGPVYAYALYKDKRVLAAATAAVAVLFDAFDGPLARASKRGGTEQGGKNDNEADKRFALWSILSELLTNRMEPEEAKDILGSDIEMTNEVRPRMQEEGIKASAVEPGKEAEIFNVAVLVATPLLDNHPLLRKGLQKYVARKKKGRIAPSEMLWRLRHKEYHDGKQELLALAEAA
jgi:predicted HAD superfamily phosphohydrolase YqeG